MSTLIKTILKAATILSALISGVGVHTLHAKEETVIAFYYIERTLPRPPTLSNLDPIATDIGLKGAQLAINDSNTTGQFLGQKFTLDTLIVPENTDLVEALKAHQPTSPLIIANLPSADLLALSNFVGSNALIFNVGSRDTALRDESCRANVLHTLPSWSMLSDALAQFMVKKKWSKWLLLTGPRAKDKKFSNALRISAKKFGTKIIDEATWNETSDIRRNAHEEIPRLTNSKGYDAIAVADHVGDFGRYLPFNTYHPRPIIGSEGLRPVAWSREVEQWGAAQLQSRFHDHAKRPMKSIDYAAWAAIRAVAEAVTRTNETDIQVLQAYLFSEKFQLAAFKGRKMSFRTWNGQLRQPIPLVHTRSLVALAPIDGFLHPVTEMDTLGIDRRQSKCEAFEK